MQEPAWRRRFAAVKTLAIEPDPQAVAAFDAKIVARQGASGLVAPPRHGDALGSFRGRDLVQHAPPAKPRRRSVRDFGDRLDRLGPAEQPARAGRRKAVLK